MAVSYNLNLQLLVVSICNVFFGQVDEEVHESFSLLPLYLDLKVGLKREKFCLCNLNVTSNDLPFMGLILCH